MGDCCFKETEELRLIGLKELERVVIGNFSFTKSGYDADKEGMNPNRHFYLKNCEKLRELMVGCYSFVDYSELNEVSCSFWFASLELNSDSERMK